MRPGDARVKSFEQAIQTRLDISVPEKALATVTVPPLTTTSRALSFVFQLEKTRLPAPIWKNAKAAVSFVSITVAPGSESEAKSPSPGKPAGSQLSLSNQSPAPVSAHVLTLLTTFTRTLADVVHWPIESYAAAISV